MVGSPFQIATNPTAMPVPWRKHTPLHEQLGARAMRLTYPLGVGAPVGPAAAETLYFRYGPEIGMDRIIGYQLSVGNGDDNLNIVLVENNTGWFYDHTFGVGTGRQAQGNVETFNDSISLSIYFSAATIRNIYLSFFNFEVVPSPDEAAAPPYGIPIQQSSVVTANATASATINGVAGKYIWVTGCAFTGGGATVAGFVTATLNGIVGGNYNVQIGVPASPTTPIVFQQSFGPPLRSTVVGGGCTWGVPALGVGNTNMQSTIWGYAL